MRRQHHVWQVDEARFDHRLTFIDVERSAGDALLFQRLHQRFFVDDRPARRVDEIRGGPHQAKLSSADQMDSLGAERGIHRDKVRLRQKLIYVAVFNAERSLARLVKARALGVKDSHAESSGPSRHGFANGAEPDDPQSFAVNFTTDEMVRLAPGKNPGAQRPIPFHDPSRYS